MFGFFKKLVPEPKPEPIKLQRGRWTYKFVPKCCMTGNHSFKPNPCSFCGSDGPQYLKFTVRKVDVYLTDPANHWIALAFPIDFYWEVKSEYSELESIASLGYLIDPGFKSYRKYQDPEKYRIVAEECSY